MLRSILRFFCAALVMVTPACLAQSLPSTAGETLSGKPIVLADAVRGHTAVLVAGFSREGGNGTGDWVKAIQRRPCVREGNGVFGGYAGKCAGVYPRDDPQWDEERAFAGGAG